MTLCSICPRLHDPVDVSGPLPCRILAISEHVGPDEIRRGYNFAGQAGRELRGQYLPLAGLAGSDVAIVNLMRCGLRGFRKPTPEQLAVCAAHHLPDDIRRCRPELIVLLGGPALRICAPWLGGDEAAVDRYHGFTYRGPIFGYEANVLVSYNPAAGLHQTALMTHLRSDFAGLGRYLAGDPPTPPSDAHPEPLYFAARGLRPLGTLAKGPSVLGVDTENVSSSDPTPLSVQVSEMPGSGMLLWADDADAMLRLDRIFEDCLVVLHGAAHDLPVLQRLGIRVPRWIDTMQLAYHRCGLPLGLKSLAYRTVGMAMRDYSDVVGPYAHDAAVDYLLSAYAEHDWPAPAQDMRETKAGWRLYTPPSIPQRLARCLTASDPRKSWEALLDGEDGEDAYERRIQDRAAIEARCGRMPEVGLSGVPQQEVIEYAVRDADATLRVWEWMGRPGL